MLALSSSLKIVLTFEGLSYRLRDGTYVLTDASGSVSADEITIMMGPSGCGKSTLLNLLSGKLSPHHGSICLNGKPGSVRELHKLIAFVPQDDIMLSSLTVMELLWFSAVMRLPANLPRAQRIAWVHMIIDLLGLTQQRHTVVGDVNKRGLSGGQRKRVNVGIELVADPSLIFLDEPTSGLDSTSSLELMQCLHRLSTFGVAVCAVLHQPRLQVFELAHQLLLLEPAGRTVYMGPTRRVAPYFESLGFRLDPRENVADQLLDVVTGTLQPSGGEAAALSAAWNSARARAALNARHSGAALAAAAAAPASAPSAQGRGSPVHAGRPSEAGGDRASLELPELHSIRGHHRRTSSGFGLLSRWLGNSNENGQTRLEQRLKESGGRVTVGLFRQVRLFVWRSALQLERSASVAVRDLMIICVAGTLLGFLFEGTYEKARCEGIFDHVPNGANYSAKWETACKAQVWERRSWFERPAFYCYSEAPYVGRALVPERLQFREVYIGYRQALNLLLLASAIISIQVSLNMLGAERPVFWRESRHYSVGAYLLGKNVAQLPLTIAYPFFYATFVYQFLRPYAPFQTVYLIFLLMQWTGEGIGQLISLTLNSSRQLAGGVAALIATVLTGSFPLLNGLGPLFTILSSLSFCRWGMVALLSVEFAPWYMGEPTHPGGNPGCCAFPPDLIAAFLKSGDHALELPVACDATVKPGAIRPGPYYPQSRADVGEVMNVTYQYTAWLPQAARSPGANVHWLVPDIYPLPGSLFATAPGRYKSTDAGFSLSALTAIVLIGLAVRVLVYLCLRCMDRNRRR